MPLVLSPWEVEHTGEVRVWITSIEYDRISDEPGYDRTTVTFEFSRPVVRWTVRVGSVDETSGQEIEGYDGKGSGFGVQPFGTSPFGGASTLVTEGSVEIDHTEVNPGENDIGVYGRDLSKIAD